MGKILACCLIGLACLVSTRLATAETKSSFSGFFSGQEIPEKYTDALKGRHILYFGAKWCAGCRIQKPIVKSLEKEISVKVFDAEEDVDLYNYVRGEERRIPLTIIIDDGKVVKKYVGVHNALKLKKDFENEGKKRVVFRDYKPKYSDLIHGRKVPEGFEKYADLWTCNTIIFFGNKNCSLSTSQIAILKGLEREGFRVKYFSANDNPALYDYMREGEERVPLTIIFVDGKIKKTFVGTASSLWIRPQAKDCMKCDKCKE